MASARRAVRPAAWGAAERRATKSKKLRCLSVSKLFLLASPTPFCLSLSLGGRAWVGVGFSGFVYKGFSDTGSGRVGVGFSGFVYKGFSDTDVGNSRYVPRTCKRASTSGLT